MLILTREEGEKLLIGENVTIKVLGVIEDQFRVGIIAPHDVTIRREEVLPTYPKRTENVEE